MDKPTEVQKNLTAIDDETQREVERINDDIARLKHFKRRHGNLRLKEGVDKLIYVLIVQKNRLNSGYFLE